MNSQNRLELRISIWCRLLAKQSHDQYQKNEQIERRVAFFWPFPPLDRCTPFLFLILILEQFLKLPSWISFLFLFDFVMVVAKMLLSLFLILNVGFCFACSCHTNKVRVNDTFWPVLAMFWTNACKVFSTTSDSWAFFYYDCVFYSLPVRYTCVYSCMSSHSIDLESVRSFSWQEMDIGPGRRTNSVILMTSFMI